LPSFEHGSVTLWVPLQRRRTPSSLPRVQAPRSLPCVRISACPRRQFVARGSSVRKHAAISRRVSWDFARLSFPVSYALQSFLSRGGTAFESTQVFIGDARRSTTGAWSPIIAGSTLNFPLATLNAFGFVWALAVGTWRWRSCKRRDGRRRTSSLSDRRDRREQ
jgi:hypothetical protein